MLITGIALTLLDIPAGYTQEFNRWYDLDHMPEHVSKRDVVMGRRYVATRELQEAPSVEGSDKHAPYATIYFFGGELDFAGDEAKQGWADKDRVIRKGARFWNGGGGIFSVRARLADARVRHGEPISADAIPHLADRGVVLMVGRVGRERRGQALAWWDEKQYLDLFSVPGVLVAMRFEPTDPPADATHELMVHVVYTESPALTTMESLAAERRRQARLGRWPAYDGSYESVLVLPYQRIVPFEYDFEPGDSPGAIRDPGRLISSVLRQPIPKELSCASHSSSRRSPPPRGEPSEPGSSQRSSATLTYAESLRVPCETCTTAACCTYLPIHTFEVTNLAELSFAQYLLNFEHFRLGLNANSDWSAYYVYPCRHLDRATLRCGVHATPEQPQICSSYNAYQCWYRSTLSQSSTDTFIPIDRARFERFTSLISFDDLRNIVGVPAWPELVAELNDVFDDDEPTYDSPMPDAAYDSWLQSIVPGGEGDQARTIPDALDRSQATTVAEVHNPCDGCAAPCCETVVFPQSFPTSASSIDYFRFCLGFPGVELHVSDSGWALAVKTRCRHLRDNRCSIYGRPERPQFCTFYDAWKCTFRTAYGRPRPNDSVRVRYQHVDVLASSIEVEDGKVSRVCTVEELRARIESTRVSPDGPK